MSMREILAKKVREDAVTGSHCTALLAVLLSNPARESLPLVDSVLAGLEHPTDAMISGGVSAFHQHSGACADLNAREFVRKIWMAMLAGAP